MGKKKVADQPPTDEFVERFEGMLAHKAEIMQRLGMGGAGGRLTAAAKKPKSVKKAAAKKPAAKKR